MITNIGELSRNSLRKKALLIADAGYEAIDIEKSMPRKVKRNGDILTIEHISPWEEKTIYEETKLNLADFENIFIVGIGKGSALASVSLAEILGDKLTRGIALDVQNPEIKNQISKIKIFTGTHPLPSKENIFATQKIMELAGNLTEKDLLISVICGGGSALACASESELNASILATKALTKSGADIIELNTVRKHLSEFKAGGLAKLSCPATLISLIVSDVCGNDLSMVSSGPTVSDYTTKTDAENILKKYGLSPEDFSLIETPKDEKYFKKTKNILLVYNEDAVMAMFNKARELGLEPRIKGLAMQGEAKDFLLPFLDEIKSGEAYIFAGETTVNFGQSKIGKGGRNMEVVLGGLKSYGLNLKSDIVIVSFASDGHDNTEAAGAIGDEETLKTAQKLGLSIEEYLDSHSTFEFFKKTGDLIYAEPKSFNVADLMIVLKE
ncbi:MAG: DUF4147 domain-containing protein [Candidatus Wolfebacteria bacterium]|nr:DUF4147 domain-containing protein [Candidatus Wolfebacteria bacterium]